MKPTKIVMAVAAALGILAVFALPYVSEDGFSMKYWDIRKLPVMGAQVYIALFGMAVVLAVSVHAILRKRLARWAGIVGVIGSVIAILPSGVRNGMFGEEGMSTAIGGKVLFLAVVVGLIASILGAIKPENKPA